MNESLARALVFALMCLVLVLTVKALRWAWRALRAINVEAVAHTAGALTSAAQDRASRAAEAFKAGRGR